MIRITAGLLLVALGTGVRDARAQEIEVGLAGGQATDEHGASHAALTLSPSLTWTGDASVLRLRAQGTAFRSGFFGAVGAEAATTAARWGPVRLALSGEGAVTASSAGYVALHGALHPRLQLAAGGWGVEAGPLLAGGGDRGGAVAMDRLDLIPGGQPPEARPLRWRGERGIAAAAWGRRGPVSARGGWRARDVAGARWQEWSGRAALEVGNSVLGLSAGRRTSGLREGWMAASVEARLSESLSLAAEAGSYPSDPLTGRAGGRYATAGIGLRLGGGSAVGGAPLTRPAAPRGERIRLSLRARPGARVELLGDWTGWRPQPVREVEPGEYVVEVALPAGAHRFLFRVDGEWRTPEGYATEPDEFGGEHAVIRVR